MFAVNHTVMTEAEMLSEIKWLKRELDKTKSKEESSNAQLNTNNHMLAAFQQSIESLTNRLEHETKQNEVKEKELERLRSQSVASSGDNNPNKGGTLQRFNTYNGGSFSDFSDIDNENPSHFERRRKTRKSWKGSLTRAFARKKKGWEEEWGPDSTPSPTPAENITSPVTEQAHREVLNIEHSNVLNGRFTGICDNCQKLQTQLSSLSNEVQDLRNKSKPNQNSLTNYVKDERTDRQVLYRIAVLVHCYNTQYTIGSVGITDTTSWVELDGLIVSCLANHVHLIDPGKQLGLRTTSLRDYSLDAVQRKLDGSEEPPTVDLRDMRGAIVVNFKSGCNCDGISYDSLLPVSFLRIAQSALKMEHVICVSGARYTGKTHLAELLGKNLLSELKPEDQVHNVVIYESGELGDKESVDKFENRLSSSSTPVVAIITDYSNTAITNDTIKSIKESHGYKNSYIILITEDTEADVLRNVRNVRCSPQCEPYHGLLDRHFNRLLATQPKEMRPKLKHIFHWIVSVWRHVNDTLKQHVDGTCLIGPTQFMSCPMDGEKAEEWFCGLWNMTLSPYIIRAVKHGLETYGRKHACWADPVDFIKGSYPWTTSKEYCDLLQGINSSEINFDSYRNGPLIGGSNVITQDQIEELVRCLKDHLSVPVTASTTPSSTPCHSSRDLSCDPMPPTRTTSCSGSDEGISSSKAPDAESGYRSMRRRGPSLSPTKPIENGYRENGMRPHHPPDNGYHSNGTQQVYPSNGQVFQRAGPGRQSLPVNGRHYNNEQYGNMYYGQQRPLNATPMRTTVQNSYNNMGKV